MHDLLTQWDAALVAQWTPLALFGKIWPYVIMLLGFSLIVFVHELGHFAAAKWAGVRVEKFAIGFGRELLGFSKGETRYSFNLLPLGGYVKMLGQEDFDDKANELKFKDDPRSFVNKPVGHRMIVVSAGVVMNVLFACLLFMIVFMVGVEAMGTRIAYVEPDSPADRAGFLPGDVIKKINGKRIVEFREVYSAVMLAGVHEPLVFHVDREGQAKHITVKPEYLIPENTREARRQIVGITPGKTREIWFVGPDIDETAPNAPRAGDILVEIDGVPIADENASQAVEMVAYAKGDIVVERADPDDPQAPPSRVTVNIPPLLTIYPSEAEDGTTTISVLGLTPLVRFDLPDERGRASLAGIEAGDTVLEWDDIPYPTKETIARAIRECPERDIHFTARKLDGRLVEGFVRPKRNRRGPATVQAIVKPVEAESRAGKQRLARFTDVRPFGRAALAGIEIGDIVLACNGKEDPTVVDVQRIIRTNAQQRVFLTVRKADGRELTTSVEPEAPGSIDARYTRVADDLLRVGEVVPTIQGKPSPAAQSGIEPGSLIKAVNGTAVARWRNLIDAFRNHAGSIVELTYEDRTKTDRVASIAVPHSLRTLLGVGPEARILSVDRRRTVMMDTKDGPEKVAVGYRKGLRTLLSELIGRKHVPVEYRKNPLSDISTGYVDVTEDMVDPWLGRITLDPNIQVLPEMQLLRGENVFDAVWIGVHKTYYFILMVYKTMERMIFTRSVGFENISGPLGIIDLGGKVARTGWVQFIFFMAIISANLAVINFLPLPIVDGGLMVFLMIEKIKGSPVSLRVQVATQVIGLFLIIGTFLVVTFNDVMRLWG